MEPSSRFRSTYALAGWLFAELMLGLAMLFFASSTSGVRSLAPTTTVSLTRQGSIAPATPDVFATEEALLAQQRATARADASATSHSITATLTAIVTLQAAGTHEADALGAVRATTIAEATQAALAAQSTAEAAATQEATMVAASMHRATESAVHAQATIETLETEKAALATTAAETRVTNEALATAQAGTTEDLATAKVYATTMGEESSARAARAAREGARADEIAATQTVFVAQATVEAATQVSAGTQVAAYEATISSLSTARAATPPVPLPTIVAVNPNSQTESVIVDVDGILAGNPVAVADARRQLRRALDKYDGPCHAGIVLTFGHGTLEESTQLANAVNSILVKEFPDLFHSTAFDAFIDLNPPRGQVDIRMYFLGDCTPRS